MNTGLEYQKVCELDEVWEGEMECFEVGGETVLIVHAGDGEVRAYDPACPHQGHALIEGDLEDCVLTCGAHLWQFDVVTGKGINPTDTALISYPVKMKEGAVWVAFPQ
ncbi:MAG: Rieske 2Fe-2S domain-containing protein [Gammaproteobacteria bacterium]|nr:Rieske 2Fe-2S domain-containing protein [Gammaproteobacteria bacterium]